MLRGVVFDPRFDQLHGLHDGFVRDSPRLSQLPYDSAQEDDAGAKDAAEKRRLLKQNGPPPECPKRPRVNAYVPGRPGVVAIAVSHDCDQIVECCVFHTLTYRSSTPI